MIIIKLYYDTTDSATYPQNDEPSWTRISNIKSFPKTRNRMDETGVIIVVIDDIGGALKDTWDVREFTRMELRDEAANVIFRGYLTGKKFEAKQFTMTISGISKALQWFPLDKNYILAEGLVKANPDPHSDNSLTLEQQTDPVTDFNWAADYWITFPHENVGITIREASEDPTTTVYTAEDSGAPANFTSGGVYDSGDEDSFDAIDGDVYLAKDELGGGNNVAITPVIQGANISVGQELIGIDINISWAAKTQVKGYAEFGAYIGKTGEAAIEIGKLICHQTTSWKQQVDKIIIKESDTELAKYLTLDGPENNYVAFGSIVFICLYSDQNVEIKVEGCTVEIDHYTHDITPIKAKITDSGTTFIETATIDYTATGVAVGDIFRIGQNTGQILDDIGNTCGIGIELLSASTKYMAQQIKGLYGLQVLKKVCLLEGWHWREDYASGVFGQLVVSHLDDCADSGVDLTQANYDHDWEYEDDPEFFRAVTVYGAAAYRVIQTAIDTAIKSPQTKVIYEETITTNAEALDVAEVQLLEWKVKHPSIKIPLKGVHANIKVGTEITLTMTRPTVAEANYPVRMVERERLGHAEIKTTVYAGMGHTTIEEKMNDRMNAIMYLAQKAITDKLTSTPLGAGVAGIPWTELIGADSAVHALIALDLADNEQIDQAIDDLIAATYTDGEIDDLDDAHQAAAEATAQAALDATYTNAEVDDLDDAHQAAAEATAQAALAAHHVGATNEHDGIYNTIAQIAAFKLNKWVAPDGAVAMNAQKLTGLAAPTANGDALRFQNVINTVYDPDAANWALESSAPSTKQVRDVVIPLTNAVVYKGTWSPNVTYNFTEEENGTIDNDIGFITSNTGDDSNPEAIIIASEDGQEKVIKFTCDGDNAKYWSWRHNFDSGQISGDIKFKFKYIDNGQGIYQFNIYNQAGGTAMLVRFDTVDNEFDAVYGDGAGGDTIISVAAAADVWHYIKMEFDCVTDTYSVWFNGINMFTDQKFFRDTVATTLDYIRLWLQDGGGVNALEGFIDSIYESWLDGYPPQPTGEEKGWWYLVDQDGYAPADDDSDTPARWYEIGDWIIWNETRNLWDILRNVQGDNILKVSPGDPIQVAIDELEKIGQGSIVLLPGTHVIDAALTFNDVGVYINFEGQGDVSVLKPSGDFSAINADNFKYLTLKDFKIDTSLQTTAGKIGISVNEANDNKFIIENVTVEGDDLITTYGISIASDNGTIRKCNLSTLRKGIYLFVAHKCQIYENIIYNTGDYSIDVTNSDYCIVDLNRIDGNGEATDIGVHIFDAQHISLTDNYMDDCVVGIKISNQSDKGTYIGNTIINCSGVGIDMDHGDHNSLTANVISDCGDGIQLGANASNNYITVNKLTGNVVDYDDNSDGTNYILSPETDTAVLYGHMINGTGAWINVDEYIGIDHGENFTCKFYMGDKVDPDGDFIITLFFRRDDINNDEIATVWSCINYHTDGSGNSHNMRAWAADTLDASTIVSDKTQQFPVSGADLEDNDIIEYKFQLNNAGRSLFVYAVSLDYHRRGI